MSKMFRAVRHIRQQADKFRFELLLHKLCINLPHPTTVSIEWIRGPKRTRGQEKLPLAANSNLCEDFSQSLLLIATLFKAAENQAFQPKLSKLQIVEITSGGSTGRVVGEAVLELSQFSQCASGSCATLNLPLKRCLDPKAWVSVSIGCTHLGGIPAEGDDAVSLRSGLVSLASSSDTTLLRQPCSSPNNNHLSPPPSARPPSSVSESQQPETANSQPPCVPPSVGAIATACFAAAASFPLASEEAVVAPEGEEPGRPSAQSSKPSACKGRAGPLHLTSPVSEVSSWRPAELSVHAEEDPSVIEQRPPRCNEGQPVTRQQLLTRVASLETALSQKESQLQALHSRRIDDLGRLEEELSHERQRSADDTVRHLKELSDRDTKVGELLRQLEDIHTTLERSQHAEIALNDQLMSERRLVADLQRKLSLPVSTSGGVRPVAGHLAGISPRHQADMPPSQQTSRATVLVPLGSCTSHSTPVSPVSRSHASTNFTHAHPADANSPPGLSQPPTCQARETVAAEGVVWDGKQTVEKLLRSELELSRTRMVELRKELTACQASLQNERDKFSQTVKDWQKQMSRQQKSFLTQKKSFLQSIQDHETAYKRLSSEKEVEYSSRRRAERELTMIRKQGSDDFCNDELQSLQQEVSELTAVRDALRRDGVQAQHEKETQVRTLEDSIQRLVKQSEEEKRNFYAQRDALRNRVYELEREISRRPRESVVSRMAEKTSSMQKVAEQAMQQHTGLSQRLMELEDELINTKLSLAQSETSKDEQLDKCRRRFDGMRQQLKTYSALVSDLEVQVTELRLRLQQYKGGSSNGFKTPHWPIRSLKSFFKHSSKTNADLSETPNERREGSTPSSRRKHSMPDVRLTPVC